MTGQPGPWDDLLALAVEMRARFPDGPNPHRIGACPECGAYRADGRFPYLHPPSCSHHGDLQAERFIAEFRSGDTCGPPLTGWEV
jgi:hypothetical protein